MRARWLERLGLGGVGIAAVALVCVLLPADPRQAVGVTELSPSDLMLLLGGAVVLLSAGLYGVLHRTELPGSLVRRHAPTLLLVVLAAVAVQVLRRSGLGHWLLYLVWAVLGLWLTTLVLCLPLLYFYLRRSPVNRLARLVEKRRYEEAIRLGQALPEPQRTPQVLFNLAVAYRLAHRPDEARALLADLQRRPYLPSGMPAAVAKQLEHLGGAKPSQEATRRDEQE